MNVQNNPAKASTARTEHFDVLIVGAGISGVGSAYHMTKQCPDMSFVVLETQASFGGTWITHRYPGIRSDSDLHTFGYSFKPWTGAPIATAEEILSYMGKVIEENGLTKHIRYGHRIVSARWSNEENLWTIDGEKTANGEPVRFTANFLWMCQGYYRHSEGYTPEWRGMNDFAGQIVHPQTWPDDLDYKGKRVVVIGSGATAATLVPNIADDCAHVTMLQRSPTYFRAGRNAIEIAETLRQLQVDETWIHEIVRRKILFDQSTFTRRSFEEPEAVKKELLGAVRAHLGPDYEHRDPFHAELPAMASAHRLHSRRRSVPGHQVGQGVRRHRRDRVLHQTGLLLKSGKTLDADVIVTATGFNLCSMGDIEFMIDNKPLAFSDTVTYRGMMFTGVPNLVWVFGYFRASWTLRVDLVADFVCRLLNHMKATGTRRVAPALRPEEKDMPLLSWIDSENFNPGYMMRGMHLLPKRGSTPEWQHTQDFWTEKDEFPTIRLDDPVFVYG